MNLEKCPQCGGTKFVRDYIQGSLICKTCGLVLEERAIDTGPYWYTEREEKRHTGPPVSTTVHDLGISSKIDRRDRDALGRKLSEREVAKFKKLRMVDRRARITNSERTLLQVLQTQARLCYSLGLPNLVKERAAILFRKAFKARSLRGHSVDVVAAAAVYLACRELGIIREMRDIAKEAGISLDKLRRTYGLFIRSVHTIPSQVEIAYLLRDAAKKLGLSDDLCAAVMEELRGFKTLNRRNAIEQIAAVIFKECQKRRRGLTQARIAEALRLSRAALSKTIQELECEDVKKASLSSQ